MADSAIKSRPVYRGLHLQPHARRHLFALEGEGALALEEQAATQGTDFLGKSSILYVAHGSQPHAHGAMLQRLGPQDFWEAPTVPTLLVRLRATLSTSTMGTRLYIAGTEGFIGQAMQIALEFGVDPNSIITEHRGSRARRVQCVHCKGITDDVRVSPFPCGHCGLTLLVRDHYSRRIGAFQGVNIDAEAPGTAPAPQELFP
jgi:dimethylamine monooxygenase subunit C